MKKEIREVDTERGILQITVADERWYVREVRDVETGLPTHEYVPSVTWICSRGYPKGIGFQKFLANSSGWNDVEAIKQAAGEKGSRVHRAIQQMLEGPGVGLNEPFDGVELTPEECDCLVAFADWWKTLLAPKVIATETVVWGKGYAGTIDLLVESGESIWLIDYKTSQDVYPEHELQVTAYGEAWLDTWLKDQKDGTVNRWPDLRLGILQVGYRKNKRGWKFTEVDPQPELFKAAMAIWAKETSGEKPRRREYPLVVKL